MARTPRPAGLVLQFFATLSNWRAFFAYGLALVLLSVICSFALFVLALLVRGLLGSKSQNAFILVMLPVMLSYVPILFASFYASYRDVFAPPVELEAEHASAAGPR